MGRALSLAIADAFAPAERRLLLLTVGGTILLLVVLWIGISALLPLLHFTGWHWLNLAIDVLGSAAAAFLAWLIFPTAAILILGFFLDRIIASIAVRLAALALLLNLLALPLYLFLPLANILLFFALNGYLVGREYFEAVAYRRLEEHELRAMWRRYRIRLMIAGALIAFALSVPVLNLAAPLIGVAFMLHLFEGLRAAPPRNFSVSRA